MLLIYGIFNSSGKKAKGTKKVFNMFLRFVLRSLYCYFNSSQ